MNHCVFQFWVLFRILELSSFKPFPYVVSHHQFIDSSNLIKSLLLAFHYTKVSTQQRGLFGLV